jgi:ubiquinone/menaquinone biosynthesis C-methylase UbiE
MLKFTDIDFNAVWQETFGWNAAGDTDNRKFNDQAENDFWVRLAPRYTQEYNLNHDTSLIADKLAGLLGRNKTILEIGCGSGNFTLLMAQYSQQILGLDFSPAMLAVLEERPKVSAIFARRQANGKILQLTLYSTTSSVSIHSTVSAT